MKVSIDSYQELSARANSIVESLRQKMKAQEEEIRLLSEELAETKEHLEHLQASLLKAIESDAPAITLIGHSALKAYRDGSF